MKGRAAFNNSQQPSLEVPCQAHESRRWAKMCYITHVLTKYELSDNITQVYDKLMHDKSLRSLRRDAEWAQIGFSWIFKARNAMTVGMADLVRYRIS